MHRTRFTAALGGAAMLLMISACTPTPRPPLASADDLIRTFAFAPEAAQARFREAASSLGLTVGPDGTASGPARSGAAACPRINVTLDGSEQIREARLQRVTARIVPTFVAQGDGTRVSLSPSYEGRYLHTLRYDWFDRACEATGDLERALLDAMASG